jgi:SWI/SNF-related matrix-associated actin-dependent regulator of chromatin subfamily A member 5
LVQLRKVCDHPYLFQGIEEEGAPELGDHLIKTCGKMQFMDKLLKKSYDDKSQTLIFSGFTSMLDILEDYCRFREYKYCRLDGNTELDDRQSQIDDFTSPGTDKFIFLISTRAGGLGLNLMTANTVILYDSDWNPQMDLQAMDRAHRIGQKKQVRVYRLITKNTMEEKMVEKQTMKLKLDSLIIQKGRMAPKNTGLQKDDLKDMVNYGADAIFEIGSNIDEQDIE